MKYGSLILEKKEFVYLKRILNISGYAEDFETQKSLQRLSDELKTAHILDEEDMPVDVIRFNSKVIASSDSGWERTFQIVVPADKDLKLDKVSILTPMGSALFGYSKTDVIDWKSPTGIQHITVKNVEQDELQNKMEVAL